VHYHGYFTNGQVFDSSVDRGERSTFNLNQVIRGWQEGIPLFSRGGQGILLIPSRLAYGNNPRGGIPASSVLIFEVELFDF
jgi:FKBP-type peptidyl-prolyl cis-trans isomerase